MRLRRQPAGRDSGGEKQTVEPQTVKPQAVEPHTLEPLPPLAAVLPLPAGALIGIAGEHHHETAVRNTIALGAATLPPNGDYDDYLIELAAKKERALRWFTARLVAEPENPFDPGAIAVYSDAGKVGYLSRDHARDYRDVFARLEQAGMDAASCPAFVRIDSQQVVLALSWPSVCAPVANAARQQAAWQGWKRGESWEDVAHRVGYSTAGRAHGAARAYAEHAGLEVPPALPRKHVGRGA